MGTHSLYLKLQSAGAGIVEMLTPADFGFSMSGGYHLRVEQSLDQNWVLALDVHLYPPPDVVQYADPALSVNLDRTGM